MHCIFCIYIFNYLLFVSFAEMRCICSSNNEKYLHLGNACQYSCPIHETMRFCLFIFLHVCSRSIQRKEIIPLAFLSNRIEICFCNNKQQVNISLSALSTQFSSIQINLLENTIHNIYYKYKYNIEYEQQTTI